jgi:hypothetical protein
MALVTISKIPCVEFGNIKHYELDTKLFNESIFKMCTKCGVFAHDFSEFYCDCGQPLDYVDVSDIDSLRIWIKNLDLLDKQEHIVEQDTIEEEDSIDNPNRLILMDEEHICYNGGDEECTNEDCIDCNDNKFPWYDDGSDGSVMDNQDQGFYLSYDYSDCEDNYNDEFEDCDSVS